jgi:uncharacterized cupredoxin-like copper-binding protein
MRSRFFLGYNNQRVNTINLLIAMITLSRFPFPQFCLKSTIKLLLALILTWGIMATIPAIASPLNQTTVNLTSQPLIKIPVSLGNAEGALKFFPNHLELEAGKRYELLLTNPSPVKHYFTAKDFADAIWTQKVDAGNVEIKGAIHELELRPGSQAQWVVIPLRSGNYNLRCTIPGHTEAGMTGDIAITSPKSV